MIIILLIYYIKKYSYKNAQSFIHRKKKLKKSYNKIFNLFLTKTKRIK